MFPIVPVWRGATLACQKMMMIRIRIRIRIRIFLFYCSGLDGSHVALPENDDDGVLCCEFTNHCLVERELNQKCKFCPKVEESSIIDQSNVLIPVDW